MYAYISPGPLSLAECYVGPTCITDNLLFPIYHNHTLGLVDFRSNLHSLQTVLALKFIQHTSLVLLHGYYI